jgi:hypothetical protein
LSFWDDIVTSVMKDFLRLPWGGHEVGGVLFGTKEADGVRIAAYRPVACEHAKGPAFELSENDNAGVRKLLDEAASDKELTGLQPVGWFHSKYRSFDLTKEDVDLYNRYFPAPWQVSMVFLGSKSEACVLGFFSRREDGSIHRSSCRQFTVLETRPEGQPEPNGQRATATPPLPDHIPGQPRSTEVP